MSLMKIIGYMFIAYIAIAILCGTFGGGVDNTVNTVDVVQTTPTATPKPVESSVDDFINVYKSGQDDIIECKHLSVSGNNNAIQIANSDVEKITILGYGNSVSYSCNGDPQIIDHGEYNDVWQRWLT